MNELTETDSSFIIDGVAVVTLDREYPNLQRNKLQALRNELRQITEGTSSPRLILDVTDTRYFASAFIHLLTQTLDEVTSRPDGFLAICGLSENCSAVLKASKVSRELEIHSTLEAALAAVPQAV